MRFQPKRFVVEVKRGTSRASFTSADTAANKFSDAEEMLFGAGVKTLPPLPATAKAAPGAPGGRILRSLIEPPPAVPEMPEPVRRGRKPGSKNKPKVTPTPSNPDAQQAPRPGAGVGPTPAQPVVADERPAAQTGNREAEADAPAGTAPVRVRLRQRSNILKRYVLDIEPGPGQAGSLRARRAARASR